MYYLSAARNTKFNHNAINNKPKRARLVLFPSNLEFLPRCVLIAPAQEIITSGGWPRYVPVDRPSQSGQGHTTLIAALLLVTGNRPKNSHSARALQGPVSGSVKYGN
ncbi:hypothetical protein ElyMa_005295800 [Elysia marginata]|uniref:Uncharacterized protein n=1 Tax=Elysia marginata TaxID=1093978 RepID=A0AAV4K0B9_9GAST|nr:hypothetical protein ElyMa_005295800 [Elysia marginata]